MTIITEAKIQELVDNFKKEVEEIGDSCKISLQEHCSGGWTAVIMVFKKVYEEPEIEETDPWEGFVPTVSANGYRCSSSCGGYLEPRPWRLNDCTICIKYEKNIVEDLWCNRLPECIEEYSLNPTTKENK